MLSIINTADMFGRQPLVNDHMECIFSPDDIDKLPQPYQLVNKDGAAAIHAHEITIITGSEAARTALFAKMIAATVITRNYPFATGMTSPLTDGKVLWIDSVNSLQATAQLASDMKKLVNANSKNFLIAALAALGTDQEYETFVKEVIMTAVSDFKPHLIIINNLDCLFPYVRYGFAKGFVEYLRDYANSHNAAVCAIGHNLIGKVKKTTGYVGELLFPVASTVYRVSERTKKQSAITHVSCYKTFHRCPKDFAFTINEFNFPQQVDPEQDKTGKKSTQQAINQIDNEQ